MEFLDLDGLAVKVGKTSITAKNSETGKTAGIVKGLTRFKDLQANKQYIYFKDLKALNIWGNSKIDNIMDFVFIIDNKIAIIENINSYKYKYQPIFADAIQYKIDFFNSLRAAGVQVVQCTIL